MADLPAVSLAAVPGRRARTVELAVEIEKRGFSGIYGPSLGDVMGLMLSIAHATNEIPFGTSVQPIYLQHASALASSGAYINEISEGRFNLGIGVTHGPVQSRLGVQVGKPLSDMRNYVNDMRAVEKQVGELPRITLATLRRKMVELSAEIGGGAVWANASRSAMATSLSYLPADVKDGDFFIANMIPTVIDDDRQAAGDRNRKTLASYVALPNYRNYWKAAGYEEEMNAIQEAIEAGEQERVPSLMSDEWLSDCTLYGSVGEVREGVEAWMAEGVTPIIVPSSASGGQLKAIEELFDAYA